MATLIVVIKPCMIEPTHLPTKHGYIIPPIGYFIQNLMMFRDIYDNLNHEKSTQYSMCISRVYEWAFLLPKKKKQLGLLSPSQSLPIILSFLPYDASIKSSLAIVFR